MLLGRRPQRLGEQRDVLERDRQLAGAGADDRAVGADQVAEVEVRQAAELLLAEHVLPAEQLDAPGAVDEVEERGLALPAARGDAAGHADAHVGLTAGLEVVVALARLRDRDDAVELVRERVDARGADLLQLAPSGGEDLCFAAAGRRRVAHATSIFVIFSSRFLPLGSVTLTVSPFLRPSSALPTGDSLESRFSDGVGLGRADDRVLQRLAGSLVLDGHLRADADDVAGELGRVDHRRGAQLVLERRDARLEHRLLVLGVVVLGVLRDVAELARFLDALGDLAALVVREVLDLGLQLVEAFRSEEDVLLHSSSS